MVAPLVLALALPSLAAALTPLSDAILARLVETASTSTLSWENGTLARALTEFNHPELTPFRAGFVGALSSNTLAEDTTLGGLARATLVSKVEAFGPSSLNSTAARQGTYNHLSLLDDGAAGDPASLGEVVVWANYSGWSDFEYGTAAEDEITYLLRYVPRSSNGAISHRRDQAQLWSDSTYMVPPFLAYYAAITNNQTLMTEAFLQCQRYREVMKSKSGVWKHILLGEGSIDEGEWATGNGWAAAGMVRVLASMRNSGLNLAFQSQQQDLQRYIEEILSDADVHQFANGLMHNYILNQSSFPDAAGPIMLAGAAYRLSAMDLTSAYVPYAERTYNNVSTYLNSAAGPDGWVAPVVNPYDWSAPGSKSPEAQSFVLIMEAARRDWVANGSQNETGQAGPGEPENAAGALAPRGVFAGLLAVVFALLGAFVL